MESKPKFAFFSEEEKLQLLNGSCPGHITKPMLRLWLSYRVGTAKDGSASACGNKRELIQRVISYIKNGWENNFVEKWQHLTGDPNAEATDTPVVTITENSRQDFPGAAIWTDIKKYKGDLPSFTIGNIMNYFISRRTGDDDLNKDFKSLNCKAFGLFKHGHVQNIQIAKEDNQFFIQCDCLPEMKKTLKYKIQMTLDSCGDIKFANCNPCPAGRPPLASCKHLAALCFALEEFIRVGRSNDFLTCTDRLQTWNQPRKRKLEPQTVYDIDFTRKVYGKTQEKCKKTLHDPRPLAYREANTEKANEDLLQEIKKSNPNCGFFNILSRETLHQNSHIISPLKQQPMSLEEIESKAKRIKKNLFVEEKEREQISCSTKKQSECKEWFEHRRVRITASKCKRTLLRPTTSPTKAIKEILHFNNSFQSQQMKQGLKDEVIIIQMYEKELQCKVYKMGFFISSSHPFLGATPDGKVHDKCLVEVKRVFPVKNITLTEAVCSRGICKKTDNGLIVNTNHPYYYQVQQQLFCVGLQWADLVLSDLNDIIILGIKLRSHFPTTIVPKLERFYDKYIAVELAYPRIALGLPRLGKILRET